MEALVRETRAQIGFKHPIVAAQVRQGDSCFTRRRCWGLGRVVEAAKELQQKYGVNTIYLATDSAKVIQSTKQYPDFDFVYLDIDRHHFANDDLDGCHKSGQCDSIEDMRTMLLDLAFMVESDFFIGAFSTNVARLAYELMAARKQCYPPFISMDIPWCHNGGNPDPGTPLKWRSRVFC